ncbi:beta-lactamase family protein [Trichomonas vaginalis G3]|uniref:Beta-lactamase family protein n=2 Tax=Trichomonas vaginalis (strain ATCC PRA-98 / G3) TaxID=412133 RepID=A2FRV9_TRIV3|nr:beta-lactamase family protein [Trichomonas vaginalis G3]|eukprot:XP_001305294.1 beta-lactamase family protein [Trichomonas vaginalis G3]
MLIYLISFARSIMLPGGVNSSTLGTFIPSYIFSISKTNFVSAAVSISYQKQILYEAAFGYADIESKTQATTETYYEWGTITKLLAHIAIFQLKEQGKLSLEDDVTKHLGNHILKRIKSNNKIYIKNLLNYDTGYDTTYIDNYIKYGSTLDVRDYIRWNEPKQIYDTGKRYSDTLFAAIIEAMIVEKISDMKYSDYVEKNIFQKLGMNHTSISQSRIEFDKKLTSGYQMDGNKSFTKMKKYSVGPYPATTAIGTLRDLTVLVNEFILIQNQANYLKSDEAKSKSEMTTQKLRLFESEETVKEFINVSSYVCGDTKFGQISNGFFTEYYNNVKTLFLKGKTIGSTATILFTPELGFSTVIMTNLYNERMLNNGLNRYLYGFEGRPTNISEIEVLINGTYYKQSEYAEYGIRGYYQKHDEMILLRDAPEYINFDSQLYVHIGNNHYQAYRLSARLDYIPAHLYFCEEQKGVYYPGEFNKFVGKNESNYFIVRMFMVGNTFGFIIYFIVLLPGGIAIFIKEKKLPFLESRKPKVIIGMILTFVTSFSSFILLIINQRDTTFITHQIMYLEYSYFIIDLIVILLSNLFIIILLCLDFYRENKSWIDEYINPQSLLSGFSEVTKKRKDKNFFRLSAMLTVYFSLICADVHIGFSFYFQLYYL